MKKLYKFPVWTSLVILSFISLNQIALASSSSDDTAVAGFITLYFAFIVLFYCFLCLSILATFIHAILAYICVLDITKRDSADFNKEMWLALIIIPGTLPYLNMLGGAFISVAAQIYYLIKVKPELK